MYRHHLEKLARTRLDDVLVDEGILDRPQLEAAQAEQDQSGRLLSDVLVDSTTIDEWDLAKLMSSHYTLPFIDVTLYSIPAGVLELLPLDWCRQNSLVPFDQFGKTISIACVEVPTTEVIQEITSSTGCMPFLYVGVRRAIREIIDETVKRRGGRTAPASTFAGAVPAGQSLPGGRKSLTAQASEAPLPALDLPRVSLKLNASAAQVAATAGTAVKRPQIERFGRPVPAPPASLVAAAAAKKVSSSGSQISKISNAPAPAATSPAPPARFPASPAPVVPRPAEPARVAASPRGAPALPPAPAKKPGPAQQTGWESIFDSGDNAVRGPDDPPARR